MPVFFVPASITPVDTLTASSPAMIVPRAGGGSKWLDPVPPPQAVKAAALTTDSINLNLFLMSSSLVCDI